MDGEPVVDVWGDLDPAATVARYWPEVAANGKENVLVGHLLSHTAGLPD